MAESGLHLLKEKKCDRVENSICGFKVGRLVVSKSLKISRTDGQKRQREVDQNIKAAFPFLGRKEIPDFEGSYFEGPYALIGPSTSCPDEKTKQRR